jgi:hypothetical protein
MSSFFIINFWSVSQNHGKVLLSFYFSGLVTLTLFVASKEVVLDVSAEETENILWKGGRVR